MNNRPLIFLDIDGVLNAHDAHPNSYNGTSAPCVDRLNRIIVATDAEIVVSSAWRYPVLHGHMTVKGIEILLLTHGLDLIADEYTPRSRVIGVTPSDEEMSPRGQQIRHWLNEHGGDRRYVVIDDGGENEDGSWYDMGIGAAGHPVVWTDGKVGLTEGDVERVIAILTCKD